MTSLSQQLKGLGANNASIVTDRKSRSRIHSKSLIFNPKVASSQDYDYLYELGLEGFEKLVLLEPRLKNFEGTLFSETSLHFDRSVQSKTIADDLQKNLDAFLVLVAPYYQSEAAIKALEWLVRRFQININNSETFLLASLPYYSSPFFIRVLNVIPKGQLPKLFEWLSGYRDQLKNPVHNSIVKAFYDNLEFTKLYTSFFVDHIEKAVLYKEQLVFFISSFVPFLVSSSKNIDRLNEEYFPLALEVVGKLLLPQKKLDIKLLADKRLTAYSLISVMSSIAPLTTDLIESFTESILQDWEALKSVSKQTLITLGHIWKSSSPAYFHFDKLSQFSILDVVDKDSIKELIAEGYQINRFLVSCFISQKSNEEALKLLDLIDLSGSEAMFEAMLLKLSEFSYSDEVFVKTQTYEGLGSFFRTDSKLAILILKKHNIKLNDLEMNLMASFDTFVNTEDDAIETTEDSNDEERNDLLEDDIEWPEPSAVDSFFKSNTDEFLRLSNSLIVSVKGKSIKSQKFLLTEFSKTLFPSKESSLSFLIVLALTPLIPLSVRLLALNYLKKVLKEITVPADNQIYLLVPIFLLGLFDSRENIRSAFGDLLLLVKDSSERFGSSRSKNAPRLFMKEEICGGDIKSRAILSPQDSLSMIQVLSENRLSDAIASRENCSVLIFKTLFRSKDQGLKKSHPVLFRAFVMTQWAFADLPVVLKRLAWTLTATSLVDIQDEIPFFERDISKYFEERESLIEVSRLFKIDFENEVEKSLVSLVGSDLHSQKNTQREAEWLLRALEFDESLQLFASERLITIFSYFKPKDTKLKIINRLIEIVVRDEVEDFDAMEVLTRLPLDHDLAIAVLANVQIGSIVPEQGLAKRRRRSSSSTRQALERDDVKSMAALHVQKLAIVLSLLERCLKEDTYKVARPDLLQTFFKILTDLEYLGNDGNLPILYVQESLASCMLLCVSQMKNSGSHKFDSNSVRADIIVNSIRTSASPQVQNRLMLVIAELASIAPEIILHAVMPIFTFMGAHTVRQDDEFSNMALQKTISKVIPALTKSSSSSFEYEVEFLLASFVTAFQHIPRHRRVNLFMSLIKTLGYDQSLHIMLFLLAQHYARSLVKNKFDDANSFLEFTVSFTKVFSADQFLMSFAKFLELWIKIPSTQPEKDSEEYTELNTRAIYGSDVLSLSDEALSSLRSNMLTFANRVIESGSEMYSSSSSIKMKIAMTFLDEESTDNIKSNILSEFRKNTSIILSSLDNLDNKKLAEQLHELLNSFMDILPLSHFAGSISNSLDVGRMADSLSMVIARNFAILANRKFEEDLEVRNYDDHMKDAIFNKLIPVLISGLKMNADVELQQQYLDMIGVIVKKVGAISGDLNSTPPFLTEALSIATSDNGLLNGSPEVIISSMYAISSIVDVLGVKSIGFFPKIVPPTLEIWKSYSRSEIGGSKLIQSGVLSLITNLVRKMPAFMTSYLSQLLLVIFRSDLTELELRSAILNQIVDHMDSGHMLKSLCNIWHSNEFYKEDNAADIGLYLDSLQAVIDKIDKNSAIKHSTLFVKWILQVFEFRLYVESANNKFDNNTIHRLENAFHTCAITYVMKLNDKSFRPLFASLVRWAVTGEGSLMAKNAEVGRLTAFFRFFNKLQEQLKSIITSYFSYLIEAVASLLNRFAQSTLNDTTLRRIVLISLSSSFKYDQDDYWTQKSRFDIICAPLLGQLFNIEDSIGKYLVKSIASFIVDVSSEEYNDIIVKHLITYISNDNMDTSSKSKLWTIKTLKAVFQRMGDQWMQYLPTLVPYIAELLEDEDEAVELEVRGGLVKVIESVLGEPLDRYFD